MHTTADLRRDRAVRTGSFPMPAAGTRGGGLLPGGRCVGRARDGHANAVRRDELRHGSDHRRGPEQHPIPEGAGSGDRRHDKMDTGHARGRHAETAIPHREQGRARHLCRRPVQPDVPRGASKAAEDGIIARINPYLDTLAKDYKAVFTSKPEYEKNLRADNGDIYGFACFRGGKMSMVFFGPMIRKDILDKAGVAVPETIDEWHTALVALKNNGFARASPPRHEAPPHPREGAPAPERSGCGRVETERGRGGFGAHQSGAAASASGKPFSLTTFAYHLPDSFTVRFCVL